MSWWKSKPKVEPTIIEGKVDRYYKGDTYFFILLEGSNTSYKTQPLCERPVIFMKAGDLVEFPLHKGNEFKADQLKNWTLEIRTQAIRMQND